MPGWQNGALISDNDGLDLSVVHMHVRIELLRQ
jgi:hypothetical protein